MVVAEAARKKRRAKLSAGQRQEIRRAFDAFDEARSPQPFNLNFQTLNPKP